MSFKPSASINLGLPVLPEVDNPEVYAALLPVYSAIRNTMGAVDSYTGNALITPDEYSQVNAYQQLLLQKQAVVYVKLTEAVSAGMMICLHNSGGLRARKAQNGAYRCHGFAVASGVIGDHIPVCMFGLCTIIAGMTIGTEYYLSSTAGNITATVTSQRLGVAIASNALWFAP